jgi:hypothetical protein
MGFLPCAGKQKMHTKCYISLNKAPALTLQSSPKLSTQVSTFKESCQEKFASRKVLKHRWM